MKKFSFIIFSVFISNFLLSAIQVDKMEVFFDGRKQVRESIILTNNGDKPEAITITVKTRSEDEFGKETREDTNDFLVFPEQVIVMPGTVKKVLIQSTRDFSRIDRELAYRVEVTPADINFGNDTEDDKKVTAGVSILLAYVISMYVVPEKEKANITASLISSLNNTLKFQFNNVGTVHHRMKNFSVEIKSKGKKIKLNKDLFDGLVNDNFLAGSRRVVEIHFQEELKDVDLTSAEVSVKL